MGKKFNNCKYSTTNYCQYIEKLLWEIREMPDINEDEIFIDGLLVVREALEEFTGILDTKLKAMGKNEKPDYGPKSE